MGRGKDIVNNAIKQIQVTSGKIRDCHDTRFKTPFIERIVNIKDRYIYKVVNVALFLRVYPDFSTYSARNVESKER